MLKQIDQIVKLQKLDWTLLVLCLMNLKDGPLTEFGCLLALQSEMDHPQYRLRHKPMKMVRFSFCTDSIYLNNKRTVFDKVLFSYYWQFLYGGRRRGRPENTTMDGVGQARLGCTPLWTFYNKCVITVLTAYKKGVLSVKQWTYCELKETATIWIVFTLWPRFSSCFKFHFHSPTLSTFLPNY